MKKPDVRKYVTIIEDIYSEGFAPNVEKPLRKIAVAAIIKNPMAGAYHEDLSVLMEYSQWLGEELSRRAVEVAGPGNIVCYGKGAIIGLNGELEHAAALVHPGLGKPLRTILGGGLAIIPSAKKVGTAGTTIDIPLHYKDACYVRSHYNAMEVRIPDSPRDDEAVVILAFTDGGRLQARVGGFQMSEISLHDGQR